MGKPKIDADSQARLKKAHSYLKRVKRGIDGWIYNGNRLMTEMVVEDEHHYYVVYKKVDPALKASDKENNEVLPIKDDKSSEPAV